MIINKYLSELTCIHILVCRLAASKPANLLSLFDPRWDMLHLLFVLQLNYPRTNLSM